MSYYQLNDEIKKSHSFIINRQKFFDNLPKEIFDFTINKRINFPNKLANFLNEIDLLCQKYGYSLSHEDGHGGFIIEKYNENNIKWLCDCFINIED